MSVPVLTVRLFGRLAAQVGERRLGPDDLGGLKPKRLLEILLLARGAPISKYRLADILWGGEAPVDALGALETHASMLRSRLGLPHPGPIVGHAETYSVVLPAGSTDLDRFDQHIELAASMAGYPALARTHLETAIDIAAHDLLEDEPYAEWAIPIRERYAALVHDASLALAEVALDVDPGQALMRAEEALSRDRLSERAVRTIMRAAWALGRQHDALLAYQRARATLRAELGVAPMEETARLAAAIRRHDGSEVMGFSESSKPLVVPPPGHEIPGTRLRHLLDWMPLGSTARSRRKGGRRASRHDRFMSRC